MSLDTTQMLYIHPNWKLIGSIFSSIHVKINITFELSWDPKHMSKLSANLSSKNSQ
jgi:hypothetical protein